MPSRERKRPSGKERRNPAHLPSLLCSPAHPPSCGAPPTLPAVQPCPPSLLCSPTHPLFCAAPPTLPAVQPHPPSQAVQPHPRFLLCSPTHPLQATPLLAAGSPMQVSLCTHPHSEVVIQSGDQNLQIRKWNNF